jgi:sensor c-di-GMP phosphodiesterase-like protein
VIDDFGTGFSSLAYLQRLPITGMKLDKSFVDPLIELDAPTTIVDAVSDLGRGLGLSVVAEGIEHAHQAELLADSGYEFGQGYLWHKPMPIAEFLALINQSKVALPA